MGIEQVLSALRSPWQNPFGERLIGTLRRDCLDHVIALNKCHLRRIVARYLDYYRDWRTHLSLSMDAPNPRTVHPPDLGRWSHFRNSAACITTTTISSVIRYERPFCPVVGDEFSGRTTTTLVISPLPTGQLNLG
jgi:hypothetical protein